MKKTVFIAVLLVPTLMSAQLLMLLNHPGQPGSGAVGLVSYTNDVAYFYGDSVTLGYLVPTNTRFSTLLSTQFSMIESNFGIGGSQIVDAGESDLITANNSIHNTNVSVWLAGYNDMRYYGTNAAALTDNMAAMQSLSAWLAIPTSVRVPYNFTTNFPAPGNIFYNPGGWGFNGALGGLAYSTAAASYASFFFSGDTLLIGTGRIASGGGAASVVVGDVVNNTFIPTMTNIYSCIRTASDTPQEPAGAGLRSYSAGLIIFTNLSTATTNHGAIFTALSSGTTFFCWYAAYATNQLPKVVLSGSLKMPEFEYQAADQAPYTNGSDFAADVYSGMISNVAVTLSAVKLNVKWVPAPILSSNLDYEYDYIHPNPRGHLFIKNAIQTGF